MNAAGNCVHAVSRQKLRFAGIEAGSLQVATVPEPGSSAAVYLKELVAPRNVAQPIVRLDLLADCAGARVRLASAFIDARQFRGQSPLVIAVAGFLATAWHVEASATSPQIQFGASLAVGSCGCGAGKPSIYVPDVFAEPSTDVPAGLLVARSGPQRFRYRAGTAVPTVIAIPAGAHLHTVTGRAGAIDGTIELGALEDFIPVLAGDAFTESFDTDDANSQLRGPRNVTFTDLAAWYVSWFEGS